MPDQVRHDRENFPLSSLNESIEIGQNGVSGQFFLRHLRLARYNAMFFGHNTIPCIDSIINECQPEQNRYLSGESANCLAEILINTDSEYKDKVEEWIQKAIHLNIENGTKLFEARSHRLYSQFHQKQNNLPKAREQMNKAIDIMKECNATGWVEQYVKELADLS